MAINLAQLGLPQVTDPTDFLGRLTRLMMPPPSGALAEASVTVSPEPSVPSLPTSLTPAALRAALLEIGVTANTENLALAQAFTQLGVALTPQTVADAHGALAATPGASALSYALAQSMGLPATPQTLRALSIVTGGIPGSRALPAETLARLGLAADASLAPEELAARLSSIVEVHLPSLAPHMEQEQADALDARSLLLWLAKTTDDRDVQRGAATLAAHLEGQQLINAAARREHAGPGQPALYFALPLQLPAEQTMMEMRMWWHDDDHDDNHDTDETDEEPTMRTLVRVATSRLGRVEAELTVAGSGALVCRLAAEQTPTVRLLSRGREKLSAALRGAGWPECTVTCRAQTHWPPLWHGGEALTAPRTRVDWNA